MKKLVLISILCSLFCLVISTPALPPWGEYYKYSAYAHVYDQNGNPKPNIWVTLSVWAEDAVTLEPLGGTVNDKTDANGYVVLNYYISWEYDPLLMDMVAYVSSSSYTTIQVTGNYTTTGNTLYPQFWVMLDVDQNEIADEWELPLAEKFCPSFKLHSVYWWIAPEPVEYLGVQKSDLWFYVINTAGQEVGDYPITDQGLFNPPVSSWHGWVASPYPNYSWLTWDAFDYQDKPPGKAYGDYHLRFHYNYADYINDPDGWSSHYQSERNNNNYRHTIYAHFFKNGNQYVIQYWIFYPYNDGKNNHEGDWEHINVIIDSQVPDEANIIRVDFYFHHKVQIRDYPDFEIEGGTHPVIYVGGAGGPDEIADGGSYPEAGWWEDVGPLSYDEWVAGLGPHILYSQLIDGNRNDGRGIVILPETNDIDYDQNPEMSWFKVKIPFGIFNAESPGDWAEGFLGLIPWVEDDVGNDGPPGPAYNAGWNKIGSVPGKYDLYTQRPN